MVLNSAGCLFPDSNSAGLRAHQCAPSTCETHIIYSVVSALCPLTAENSSLSTPQPPFHTKVVLSRCMLNRTTKVFYWLPPVHDCLLARGEDKPYFYGSIFALRQLHQTLQTGKSAAVAVREKPLVSLSVGLSALSVALVLIMLLGVCHRNAPNASAFGGDAATQRQQQAAARRRTRARSHRRNGNHTSVGTQAESDPSDSLLILPQPEYTRHLQAMSLYGDVNSGFHDSEALLDQSHDLAGHTPVSMVPVASEEVEGEYPASTASVALDNDTQQSCLSVLHVDARAEYQPPNHPPKIFKGVPILPTYDDATKRGVYCIIRDCDIAVPPTYQPQIFDTVNAPGGADVTAVDDVNQTENSAIFPPISSWDFCIHGIRHGSVNSMPEFSRIYGPPESPYPGDCP